MDRKYFKYKYYVPEVDYSGEEIHKRKTKRREWLDQTILYTVVIVPGVVSAMMFFATYDVLWLFILVLVVGGIGGYAVIGAMKAAEGKRIHLPDTYKKIDDYSEQLTVKQIHIVSLPENFPDLVSLQEDWEKQIDKLKLEQMVLAELEGKAFLSVSPMYAEAGFVLMPVQDYLKIVDTVHECYDKIDSILEHYGLKHYNEDGFITKIRDHLRQRLKLKTKLEKLQENLVLSTKPKSPKTQKIMEKVRKYIDRRYETIIAGF